MKLSINKISLKSLFVSILLFFCIYNPPLISINFTHICTLIFIFYLMYNNHYVFTLFNNRFLHVLLSFSIFLFYYFVILFLHFTSLNSITNLYISNIVSIFTTYIPLFVIVLFILVFCKKNSLSIDDLFSIFIRAGLIEAFLCILAFLFPHIKSMFVELIRLNSGNEFLSSIIYGSASRRCFGLSSNLYDMFGMSTSILFTLSLWNGVFKKSKKNIVYALIFLFVTSINARTGILLSLVSACALCLYYLYRSHHLKKLLKFIFSLLMILIFVYPTVNYIKVNFNTTYLWIMDAVESTLALFIDNEKNGIYSVLFNENFLSVPNNCFDFLFGTGLRARDLGFPNTDIGYIELIWKVGIVGLVLCLLSHMILFYYSSKKK